MAIEDSLMSFSCELRSEVPANRLFRIRRLLGRTISSHGRQRDVMPHESKQVAAIDP
jgi:hypothetical protein